MNHGPQSRKRPAATWIAPTVVAWVTVFICGPPALLVLVPTFSAAAGAETPIAAVDGVLFALDPWGDDDLGGAVRYLCPEHADELKASLASLRTRLLDDDPSYRIDIKDSQTSINGNEATVTTQVAMTWTIVEDTGQTMFYSGEAYPWTFRTVRRLGGWTVCGYESPELCDAYVRC